MNSRLMSVLAVFISFLSLGYTVYGKSAQEKVGTEHPSSNPLTKEEVVDVIKETLDHNPDLIINSVEKYRTAKMQEAAEEQKAKVRSLRSKLESNPVDPKVGPESASIKIVEFFDYNCGYCKKMSAIKAELLKTDADVQIIFKELPIMSPDSLKLSKAAIAVYQIAPNQYTAFQNALLNRTTTTAEDADIMALAASLGIDTVKLAAAIKDPKVAKVVDDNMQIAQDIGLRGTPLYIINGEVIPGAADIAELRKQIVNARAQAKINDKQAPVAVTSAKVEEAAPLAQAEPAPVIAEPAPAIAEQSVVEQPHPVK